LARRRHPQLRPRQLFNQLSGGLEALSADFDARVNVYGPVTGPKAGAPGFTTVVLQGNNIFMVGGQEVALHGVDGELGVRIPVEKLHIDPSLIEFRVYGGAYFYDASEAGHLRRQGARRIAYQ
jgi:hypothetical protein